MREMWHIDYGSFLYCSNEESYLKQELRSFTDKAIYQSIPSKYISRKFQAIIAYLYSYFPEKIRLYTSSIIKKTQGHSSDKTRILEDILKIIPDILTQKIRNTVSITANTRNIILVTHDVDYLKGYNFLLKLADYEKTQGISAAFYFLTKAGYKIEADVICELRKMGHEVGIHGNRYDLRLAYRNNRTIMRNLSYAKNYIEDILGESVYGFRNHSLILSPNILQVVQELGFKYDSGIYPRSILGRHEKMVDPLSKWFCWPFKYFNRQLWELPVTWPQDTEVFRKYNFNSIQAVELYLTILDGVLALNGLCCFNFHPCTIANNYDTFKEIISQFKEKECLFCSPISVVRNLCNTLKIRTYTHFPRNLGY